MENEPLSISREELTDKMDVSPEDAGRHLEDIGYTQDTWDYLMGGISLSSD